MKTRPDLVQAPTPESLDKEAWNPLKAYKCLCCNDIGYVVRIERALQSRNPWTRPILCKRPGCVAFSKIQSNPNSVDTRLTASECQELHDIAIADWQETMRNWHEQRQRRLIETMVGFATKQIP